MTAFQVRDSTDAVNSVILFFEKVDIINNTRIVVVQNIYYNQDHITSCYYKPGTLFIMYIILMRFKPNEGSCGSQHITYVLVHFFKYLIVNFVILEYCVAFEIFNLFFKICTLLIIISNIPHW